MSQAEQTGLFTCPICEKGFRRKDYLLKRHMLVHTDYRPFECSVCSKKFRTNQALRNHQVVHTKERQFQCAFCDKKYSFRTSLVKHERTHEDNRPRPHTCCYCSRGFLHKQHLIAHLVAHNNIRMFKCTKCGKAFNRSSHLEKHISCWHKHTEHANKITTDNQTNDKCNLAGKLTSVLDLVGVVNPDSGKAFDTSSNKITQNGGVCVQIQDVLLTTGATDLWIADGNTSQELQAENLESHRQEQSELNDWTESYDENGLQALLETWISSDTNYIPKLDTSTMENWTREEPLDNNWDQNIIPNLNVQSNNGVQVESSNASLHPQEENVTNQSNSLEQDFSLNTNNEIPLQQLGSTCSVTINSPMWCNESVCVSVSSAIQPSPSLTQSPTIPTTTAEPPDFNFFPQDSSTTESYGLNFCPPEEEMLMLLI